MLNGIYSLSRCERQNKIPTDARDTIATVQPVRINPYPANVENMVSSY